MNRPEDAEAAYLLAIAKAKSVPRCEPYIALGALKASQKKWKPAEDYYRKALTIPAGELTLRTARHNLAVLLSRNEAGWAEAENLWKQNGDYLPSQMILAESLAARPGRRDDVIQLCRKILSTAPDHLSSRLLLADELQQAGDRAAAISEFRRALSQQPDSPVIHEKLAASLAGSGREKEALAMLRVALTYSDANSRSRIQRAIKSLEQAR